MDPDALNRALSEVPDAELTAIEVGAALQALVDTLQPLFGLGGAGLLFVDDQQLLRASAASGDVGHLLERAQSDTGEGPCFDAQVLDEVVAVDDLLAQRDRWPRLVEQVVPEGVRAVLGVPVRLGGGPVGTINVYAEEPHRWDASERAAVEAFARLVETVLAHGVLARRRGELVDQLQRALDARVEIERAVGLLMGRSVLSQVAAFDDLRRRARSSRRKVVDVARQLLDEHDAGVT